MSRTIYITEPDKTKLQKLIQEEVEFNPSPRKHVKGLEVELSRAQVVSPENVPPDVITMNSKVLLEDLETGEQFTCTLVYPGDADVVEEKISVLAPVGTAILGYRVGNVVEWAVPDGIIRLKVEDILYQPEAAGHFDI